jgi:hypothetical protein
MSYISAELRKLVQTRAGNLCEYCLIHEFDTFVGCQVDHIISIKHNGSTDEDNLAYACTFCNRAKGSDIGSIDSSSKLFSRFFNPREDRWSDHFQLHGTTIEPLTVVGQVTVKILEMNKTERMLEREELIRANKYPSVNARNIIFNLGR